MSESITTSDKVKIPPRGWAMLALVGPSFVWCAEYIGSGEVILSTRTGAILGPAVLWAIIIGIFLKYWIGMSGARYTVCTGEGMIDMFARIPGPKNWVVWIVLIAQTASAAISIGSIAAAAGIFVNSLLPISPYFGGLFVTVISLVLVWSGFFNILKVVMSVFVFIIIIGVLYVALNVLPGLTGIAQGLLLHVPPVPDWAQQLPGVSANPWREILPLLGWAAGGFASQVWYTYWVLGAGYGAANGRGYGNPADVQMLRAMTHATAEKIKGWCRVVYIDATIAMLIGISVTCGFLIAGAGVLGPKQIAPDGAKVAVSLSALFSENWGDLGGFLFLLAGAAALIGTQIGQLAGWPRLLADAARICFPAFNRKLPWKRQFQLFLLFFFFSNMIIVFSLGLQPVFLVKMGAILDGLLLTPLQAIWVAIGLYVVLPRLLSKNAWAVLRPGFIFLVILLLAFLVFGYFCVFQIPFIL